MIDLDELLAIARFVEAGTGSAESVLSWCEARAIDASGLVRAGEVQAHSVLITIAQTEAALDLTGPDIEAIIAAGMVRAMQIGADAERRRRDRGELPA